MLGTAASSRINSGHSRADRDGEVGRCDLLQVELDHHGLGDLPAFGGTILQTRRSFLHFSDPPLEPRGQGFIGECRPDNGRNNLMQVGQALDGVGEGLFRQFAGLPHGSGRGSCGR